MNRLRIACIQSHAYSTREESADRHEELIRSAAAGGARILCTQELFSTPYFCREQDPQNFDLAEPIPGPLTHRFAALAAELKVVLILSLFERQMPGQYFNTAVVLDADGSLAGIYRKTHIPQDPGFEEKFYFTPGDTGIRAFDTAYGRIGVLICWDQWFPEAARQAALDGAELLFCPTAIGGLESEDEEEWAKQLRMWKTVQEGHAIANGCYWAAVNRVGREGKLRFWGSSFVSDFSGKTVSTASTDREEILFAECDFQALETHRRNWPFFRDRRPEMYRSSAVPAVKPCPSAVPRRTSPPPS